MGAFQPRHGVAELGVIHQVRRAQPAGELGPATTGIVNLQNGQTTTFQMTAFEPKDHWQWSTSLLWFTLDYDHLFQRVSDLETRIVLQMRVKGFGKNLFAFAIDRMASPDLDASIPKLIKEMNERGTAPRRP